MNNLIWLSEESTEQLTGYVFGLDAQLIFDIIIVAVAVFGLFLLLSYLLFNPARALLEKRQAKIQGDLDAAAKDKEEAMQFKAEYDAKLANADKEVGQILEDGRKKALKRESEIVEEARSEADRIRQRAEKEIELEKSRIRDDVKQEIVSVASLMAGKYVASEMSAEKQQQLLDEALNEIGEQTWQN